MAAEEFSPLLSGYVSKCVYVPIHASMKVDVSTLPLTQGGRERAAVCIQNMFQIRFKFSALFYTSCRGESRPEGARWFVSAYSLLMYS